MSKQGRIIIVQGGQWGSEAKGAIAAALCQREPVNVAIRTGAVNAGHTVYWQDPNKPVSFIEFKMQQIPTGWVNPNTVLVIGPGAFVHPGILLAEIEAIRHHTGEDIRRRLFIDYRAGVHMPDHEARAKEANRHHLIGATGKGCSEAYIAKIRNRGKEEGILFRDWCEDINEDGDEGWVESLKFIDTVAYIHNQYDLGATLLIEGTQGTHLDLHLGPYPYTTSRMTSAANWVAECGLAPGMNYETIVVARTYPIRVAGNSGPMPGEISWPILSRLWASKGFELVPEFAIEQFEAAVREVVAVRSSHDDQFIPRGSDGLDQHIWESWYREHHRVALSEVYAAALKRMGESESTKEALAAILKYWELTTVTKKLRRIATFDAAIVKQSVTWNRAKSIALTFLNYEFPEVRGMQEGNIPVDFWRNVPSEVGQYVGKIESEVGVPVRWISTGPLPQHIIRVR